MSHKLQMSPKKSVISDMTDEPTPKTSSGQRVAKQAIENAPEKLAKLTRRAQRVLASLRCGINDSDDAITSAVRTTFRHQDPTQSESSFQRVKRDPEITSEDQVWPLIEKHLERKMNTAKKQPQQRKNQARRAGDQTTEDNELYWRDCFVDPQNSPQHDDPELVESYISDAFRILREIFGDEGIDQVVGDPNLKQVARLSMMGYTLNEIAELMNISFHHARKARTKVVEILKSAFEADDNEDCSRNE